MSTVIQVSNLSKIYRLGEIGTGTLSHDLERWYKMKIRGQADPFLKIGETNESSKKGISDVVYSLKDINFEVQQGESFGIIGKNGAGKSTLLKIISRVTSPTTGKVNIKGRVASLLEVGTGFHPELTGRENIYLNGAILGMRKKEITRKLDEIIDFSGVERYIDTPVKRYSSGMYVRLAFAVAAHLESEIMIIDEVLAVGDAEFQKKCLGKMGEVAHEGRTVLFVSHNMSAIEALCETGIYLQNGKIFERGNVQELINLYSKSFKEQAENRLRSKVKLGEGVILKKFEILPNPVESGQPLNFHIEIESEQSIVSDSLVILFYSNMGGRAAIVDLRQPKTSFKITQKTPLKIKGQINAIPFVEGEYSTGIFFASSVITNNFLNLLNVTVLPQKMTNEIIPYPANVRGLINLKYEFQTN